MTRVSELAMSKLDDHAAGLGASIGGLLAARVLTDVYPTVTIIERDVLPNQPVTRRGVPRGRHVHALPARGSQVLAEPFPGLLNELVAGRARHRPVRSVRLLGRPPSSAGRPTQ